MRLREAVKYYLADFFCKGGGGGSTPTSTKKNSDKKGFLGPKKIISSPFHNFVESENTKKFLPTILPIFFICGMR